MKLTRKIIIFFLSVSLIIILGIGCEDNSTSLPDTSAVSPSNNNESTTDTTQSSTNTSAPTLTHSPAFFDFPMPEASGVRVEKNNSAEIDYSHVEDGYVMIRFLGQTDMQIKVQVVGPSGTKYIYNLNNRGEFEVFPFTDRNGTYSVGVFEQVEGNQYATILTSEIDVALVDEFAPFLRPNQYINFTPDSQIVKKAAELVGGANTFFEKVDAIYSFVITNLTYDDTFAEEVIAGGHTGYIPDLDAVLVRGRGICFDYAGLMTGMLRSQGIPTKLVLGNAGGVYHAWISVYSEEDGWIENIITFNGRTWNRMDPTFASSGNQSSNVMQFIGDGENYQPMFLY